MTKDDKLSRLDIVATTDANVKINIEIQLKNEYNMVKRTLFYWSKLYSSQIDSSDGYDYQGIDSLTYSIRNVNWQLMIICEFIVKSKFSDVAN